MAASATRRPRSNPRRRRVRSPPATSATAQLAANQVNLQDAQLSQLSTLASQLQQDVTTAVANGNGGTLMSQAQNIFEQTVQILNSQDANGNYIYGGGKANTPPVTATTMAQLMALPSAAQAFANGTQKSSVQVGSNETVQVGVLASDVGTQLMQSLQDIANFNAGPSGTFGTQLTSTQSTFLSNEIPNAQTATQTINNASGSNGEIYQQLQSAITAAAIHVDALPGLCVRYPGRGHGDGVDQSEREPDGAAGRARSDGADGPAFAAQLSQPALDDRSAEACQAAARVLYACAMSAPNSLGIAKPASATRVVVAMSGGVDSSVTAAMLKREGYDVVGITLQLYDQGELAKRKGACCAGQDIYDARRVAETLGFPHYVLDYETGSAIA